MQAWFDRLTWWQHPRAFFERYDLLLTPTVACPPFRLGLDHPAEVAGQPVALLRMASLHVSLQPDGAAGGVDPVRLHPGGAADRAPDRGAPLRRSDGAPGGGGLRAGPALGQRAPRPVDRPAARGVPLTDPRARAEDAPRALWWRHARPLRCRRGGRAFRPRTVVDRSAAWRWHMWLLRKLGILVVAILPALVFGLGAEAQTPRKGGVLRVGILGEPPALDAHWSTTALVETLTNHLYEGLYTLDQDNRPIPDARRGDAGRVPGRARLHVQAPTGRQVPQRQGADERGRGRLPQALGAAGEQGQGAVQAGRRPQGRRPLTPWSCV